MQKISAKTENPDLLADIDDFHRKFMFEPRYPGQPLDPQLTAFRVRFIAEELHELTTALKKSHVPEILDAIVDILYVAAGTAWLLGLPLAEAWERVHATNMKKVRAKRPSDSKRGSEWDVVKPPGFSGKAAQEKNPRSSAWVFDRKVSSFSMSLEMAWTPVRKARPAGPLPLATSRAEMVTART